LTSSRWDSFCWGKTGPVELRSHPLGSFEPPAAEFGGKGIGFAALSLSSARTAFSSPEKFYAS
jgi:hypothetical protein